jgi:hypothetical protein
MKFTQVAANAFQKLQLNAGVLLSEFDPTGDAALDRTKIIAATGGGVNFTAQPEFVDFGEDIDNVPANTMELKQISTYTVTMSGTAKTADTATAKRFIGAADVSGNKVTPRMTLKEADFSDIWWVGDYSDVNTDSGASQKAGYMAIKLINALSTGGFQIQSNDEGKGDFSFEFTGHYSLENIWEVPFEIYVKAGTASA